MRRAKALDATTIGGRLRAARHLARLTQAEAAEAVGITRAQLTNIELGNSEASLETFRRLCECLGTSADGLLGLATAPVGEAERLARMLDLVQQKAAWRKEVGNIVRALRKYASEKE
jgi:transcriptional regulator with XRE-family HTH domain